MYKRKREDSKPSLNLLMSRDVFDTSICSTVKNEVCSSQLTDVWI